MQNDVKVLIAEDEPNALMGLAELISGWGYRTETARDGIEAWEKVLAFDPAFQSCNTLPLPDLFPEGIHCSGILPQGRKVHAGKPV